MQSQESTQLTQVPPQPTCKQIFNTGTCADAWNNYRQALAQRQREEAQLYINRQKELASEEATAPLQKQIADLHKIVGDQQAQIKNLQATMQADSLAAQHATVSARSQGLQQGAGIGVAASLVLYGLIFGVRKLTRKSSTRPQARAASAS